MFQSKQAEQVLQKFRKKILCTVFLQQNYHDVLNRRHAHKIFFFCACALFDSNAGTWNKVWFGKQFKLLFFRTISSHSLVAGVAGEPNDLVHLRAYLCSVFLRVWVWTDPLLETSLLAVTGCSMRLPSQNPNSVHTFPTESSPIRFSTSSRGLA